MDKIATFRFQDQDIDMMYKSGQLAYTFEYGGKSYGQKVKVPDRSVLSIASVTFVLIQNAIETLEAVKKIPV